MSRLLRFFISRLFRSHDFHPCTLVPRFPFLPFPPLPLGAAFSVLAFSVLAFSASPYFGKIKQRAIFQHRISMHHAVMRTCIFHRLSIICAKNEVFGGFDGEDVKILSSSPQKALPCVNASLLVYRVSKSVQRPEL